MALGVGLRSSMRRGVVLALALALSTALGSHARAQRRGLWARAMTGAGLGSDRVMDRSFSASLTGVGVDETLALGFAPIEGLALGVEGRLLFHQGNTVWPTPRAGVRNPALLVLGGVVDYYPMPHEATHIVLGLGVLEAGLQQVYAPVGFDSMSGVFGHAGIGWTWRAWRGIELGPLLDFYRGRATQGTARLEIYGGALALQAAWF